MSRNLRYAMVVATCLLFTVLGSSSIYAADNSKSRIADLMETWFCKYRLNGVMFQRTELFFGTNKPGGTVSDALFQKFVDEEVAPRFPDGLTLLSGDGQFKNAAGAIEKERSKLLILLYVFNDERSKAVDQIRERYKEQHQQQSVLRVDERSCVSF